MPDDTKVPSQDPKQAAGSPAAAAPAGVTSPAPEAEQGPVRLTPEEERELGRLLDKRAEAESAGNVVNLKVEEPHSEMTFAGVTVSRDFTPVPAAIANHFVNAAADAGVTLTRES